MSIQTAPSTKTPPILTASIARTWRIGFALALGLSQGSSLVMSTEHAGEVGSPNAGSSCSSFVGTPIDPPTDWLARGNCSPLRGLRSLSQKLSEDPSCSAGGIRIRRADESPNLLDWVVTMEDEATGRAIRVLQPPVSGVPPSRGGVTLSPACDDEATRFFVLQPATGELIALARDGRQLWRTSLPGFEPIASHPGFDPQDPDSLLQTIRAGASVAGTVKVSGPYVIASHRTGRLRTIFFFHRSGRLLGHFGPGTATIYRALPPNTLEVLVAPLTDRSTSDFDSVADLTIRDESYESLVRHFIAWCLPLTPHTPLSKMKFCDALPLDSIRFRLGDAYREDLSRIAKRIHDDLGPKGMLKIINASGGAVAELVAHGDPSVATWDEDIYHAYLAAGADVVLEAYLREHPAIEAELTTAESESEHP